MRAWRVAATALASIACEASAPPDTVEAVVESADAGVADALAAFEAKRRAAFDPLAPRAWSRAAGPEPFAVARVDARRVVGTLRGPDVLVLLDAGLRELDRVAAPRDPTGVTVDAYGTVHVVGSTGGHGAYLVEGDRLRALPPARTSWVERGRDVAAVGGGLLLLDAARDRVVAVPRDAAAPIDVQPCNGPIAIDHADGLAAAACLFDRSLAIAEVDREGRPTGRTAAVTQLGPFISVAVARVGDRWRVAAGGIEDHALDRSDGSFGYVDPFVFVFDVAPCGPSLCATRVAATNLGPAGVVSPKWVDLRPTAQGLELAVAGYGGEAFATALLDAEGRPGELRGRGVAPGLRQLVRVEDGWLGANPLLDAWVRIPDEGASEIVAVADATARDPAVRVGEALFFTTLIAPGGDSVDAHSRFTCETCHFEGTVDGRVHFTGREDIHAATKPLIGLFPNRPHFSRALDRTLAVMVDNELAVSNRHTPGGPGFDVSPDDVPWLCHLGVTTTLGPRELRQAFMAFFEAFDHEASPAIEGRSAFTLLEQQGATLFARHCEACHQARLVTDDPASRVEPAAWERLVFSEVGPIVWATDERMQTGVVPLVHPEGARVTSLRRLSVKRPYLTNGSARSLDEVLARIQLVPEFSHAAAAGGLDPEQVRALRAFLDLL